MKKSSNHTAGWGWDGADTAHIMALKLICTEVSGEHVVQQWRTWVQQTIK